MSEQEICGVVWHPNSPRVANVKCNRPPHTEGKHEWTDEGAVRVSWYMENDVSV